MNILELQDLVEATEKKVDSLATDKPEDALVESGKLSAYREQLADAVRANEAELESLKNAKKVSTNEPKTVANQVLGNRENFNGMVVNKMVSAVVNDATELPLPVLSDTNLPELTIAPIGFIDTLSKGVADGYETFFTPPVLTNNAATWTTGTKPESAIEWTQATANPETIAHWIPILKQMARRYGVLESTISNALLQGLAMVRDEKALFGDNSSGIVGITNTEGILSHTKDSDKNLKDTFVAMKRKVRVATGIVPTCVCLSPYAIEELSEQKDTTGNYLFPDIEANGTIAGLRIIEDVNLTIAGDTTSTEAALVYAPTGATWKTLDAPQVDIGLTDTQFIENAYTLLAEETALLRVDNPACFCYCSDLGIDAEE